MMHSPKQLHAHLLVTVIGGNEIQANKYAHYKPSFILQKH